MKTPIRDETVIVLNKQQIFNEILVFLFSCFFVFLIFALQPNFENSRNSRIEKNEKKKIFFSKFLIRDRQEPRRDGIKTMSESTTMSSFDWMGTAYTEIRVGWTSVSEACPSPKFQNSIRIKHIPNHLVLSTLIINYYLIIILSDNL